MVAAKLATLEHGGDRSKPPIGGLKQEDAAALLNVGERSVERAKTVQREGVPEIVQAVERGDVSVSAAAQFAKQPKEDQARQIDEHGTAASAAKASQRAAIKAKADRAEATSAAAKASAADRAASKGKSQPGSEPAAARRSRTIYGLLDVICMFENVNISESDTFARMQNDDRIELMTRIVKMHV
jgi:hypothetical protein